MNCDGARDLIVLAAYGELPDEDALALERHLTACEACLAELHSIREMEGLLALNPIAEPDPNLLAQSRMRLDEALDAMPRTGLLNRLRAHAFSWLNHLQSAPALATLLIGAGFLAGNFTYRYQVAHMPRPQPPVVLSTPNGGGISTIASIRQLPGDMVQVSYNRVVPETAEGSLDSPYIRSLLMTGTFAADTNSVRMDSVALLAGECRIGHACRSEDDGRVRNTLLTALHADKSATVRLKALDGLQPYVGEDLAVRDAVSQALLSDASAQVRVRAVALLEPVQSDASVRQALRTVATTDSNPYIRTVSLRVLADNANIQ